MRQTLAEIEGALTQHGFAHVDAPSMRAVLEQHGLVDWDGFAESWNDLGVDTYMADGGRYRRRRHAAFSAGPSQSPSPAFREREGPAAERWEGEGGAGTEKSRRANVDIRRKPHQPHYQSRDYNALNGGLARWFEPVRDEIATHPAMTAILRTCLDIFTPATPPLQRPDCWHVELHQFRIEANGEEQAKPTPEGMHRDGVDWVLVLLVRRQNVTSGETTIHDLQRRQVGSFTLSEPMEAALVDDGRVFHGVTEITPVAAGEPAYRDVLVATFRRE